MLYFKCVMCVISEYFMAFFILKGEIFLKKQDFKRQLAAIMALAVTFSSVPPVWADEISFITDDDITLNSISTIGMETNIAVYGFSLRQARSAQRSCQRLPLYYHRLC